LIALPEAINLCHGDGPDNPNPPSWDALALHDWRNETAPLIEAARRCKVTLTIPVITHEVGGRMANNIFLIDSRGELLGRYQKTRPTTAELDMKINVGGATQPLVEWEGLKIGFGICFDTNFRHVFESQAARGADLFLVCSLWPGGSQLNYYALEYSTPIVLSYPAWSRIIDVTGKEIAEWGYRSETLRFGFTTPIVISTINFDRVVLHADYNQQKIESILRKYGSSVRAAFDQQNALFFLESRDAELGIKDVVKEFGLIERRLYLAECDRRCTEIG
jgi:predicted amidohydrolase